ncbi:hypothetical protein GGR51DRAFT_527424 [Nemania sp. FL0031]|nr:hypothetical protein GGR51DRAFT_527424 [Nemania sp. FL0031]
MQRASNSTTGNSSPSEGLDTSDIVGIAVGVASGVIALVGVLVAYMAWRYPNKFRWAKGKLQSVAHAKTDRSSLLHSTDVYRGTIVHGNVYGGQHHNNLGSINYGNIHNINYP